MLAFIALLSEVITITGVSNTHIDSVNTTILANKQYHELYN